MVSGLVTSPCDQERIFSGDARLMRIASKSEVSEPRVSKDGLIFLASSFQLPASSQGSKTVAGISKVLPVPGAVSQREAGSWKLAAVYPSVNAGVCSSSASSTGFFFVFISSTSRHSACSSRMRTLNDSGSPGWNDASPLTIAS